MKDYVSYDYEKSQATDGLDMSSLGFHYCENINGLRQLIDSNARGETKDKVKQYYEECDRFTFPNWFIIHWYWESRWHNDGFDIISLDDIKEHIKDLQNFIEDNLKFE
jgi:hypothetical protein